MYCNLIKPMRLGLVRLILDTTRNVEIGIRSWVGRCVSRFHTIGHTHMKRKMKSENSLTVSFPSGRHCRQALKTGFTVLTLPVKASPNTGRCNMYIYCSIFSGNSVHNRM